MKEIIIKVLIGLVLAWLIRRWWNTSGKDLKDRFIFGKQGDGLGKSISEDRKEELKEIASDIQKVIYNFDATSRGKDKVFVRLLAVNDNEFDYVNTYYARFISKFSLHYDVDEEIMPFYTSDNDILARIDRMNLKK